MENLLHFWQKMKWPTYSPCYSRIISIEMFKMIKKIHFWKDTTEAWAVNSNLGFCHFCTYWQPQKRISWTSTSGSTSIPVYTGSYTPNFATPGSSSQTVYWYQNETLQDNTIQIYCLNYLSKFWKVTLQIPSNYKDFLGYSDEFSEKIKKIVNNHC